MDINKACCPNPNCKYHIKANIPSDVKWYSNHGYFNTDKKGTIQRYQCKSCLKCFKLEYFDKKENKFKPYDNKAIYNRWVTEGCTLQSLAEEYSIEYKILHADMYQFVYRNKPHR